MNQRISDEFNKKIPSENIPNKVSKKAFQQFLDLIATEGQIQTLSQLNVIAKNAEKGNRGAALMAAQDYNQESKTREIGAPTTSFLETLQTGVQSELDYLTQMINILKQSLGSNNPEVLQLEQEVIQLKKDFPNLSSKDAALLNKIMSQALNLEGQLGSTAQVAFLKAAQSFLTGLKSYNNANLSTLYHELAQVTVEISTLTSMNADLKTLQELLALMKAGKPLTSAQLTQFLNAINDLNVQYAKLDPQMKGYFKGMMSGLANFETNGSSPMTIAQLMGDYQMYTWTQQYLNNPNNPKTKTGLLNYLQAQIDNYSAGTTLGQLIKDRMNSDLAHFPGTGTPGEANWVNISGDSVSSNGTFSSSISSLFTINSSQANYLINTLGQYSAAVSQCVNKLQNTASGYQSSINALNELNGVINPAISKVGLMLIYTESVQQAFADAILNHYMPGQETYLRELAAILFMDNFGTNMNNVLMNDTTDFSDAANNYNINNWIQSRSAGNGVYNGTVSSAQAQQKAEEAQASTDINKCSKAINDISEQEANLASQVAKGKISHSNAAKIHQELEKDRASLVQAKVNLQNLLTDLKQLTFSASGSNQFTISGGNLSQIADDEKMVINGDPSQDGLGGLTTIAGDIESQSQYWGGQSQTAQMQLQMTMTQIQQEWSVVTTALQMLNQMYMTVAQAISK